MHLKQLVKLTFRLLAGTWGAVCALFHGVEHWIFYEFRVSPGLTADDTFAGA
jgi:hypothetical protein